eukprot:m.393027 g.393027  ORF g.393027 m.393027 type:complete len:671 (-) comp20088_c10_seq2:83-2095(-)
MRVLALAVLCAVALAVGGSDDLNQRIYTTVQTNGACVRLLDVNGPAGCQSPRTGAVGILYKASTAQELADFALATEEGYVVLLTQALFKLDTTLPFLEGLGHYKGALVYNDGFGAVTDEYSPASIRPNNLFGLPYEPTSPAWNSVGGGHGTGNEEGSAWLDLKRPIFQLRDDNVASVMARYNQRNQAVAGKQGSYPLWAVELNSWMYATKDAETCLRRGHCEPLGSGSPWGTVRPLTSADEVVMISAKLDAMAFFHDDAFGADADASAIVAAIAAADVLSQQAGVRDLPKNIMFSLFHGEMFGYIGSSRMAWDISQSPSTFPSEDAALAMDRVEYLLELDQLMSGSDTLSLFSEYGSAKDTDIFNALSGATGGLSVTVADETGTDLPPASVRAFLREIRDTPTREAFGGAVLASYSNTGFDNKLYNSRFDLGELYDIEEGTVSTAANRVCEAATLVARAAWKLADPGAAAQTFTANCTFANELLYCVTVDRNCSLVQEYTGLFGTGPINRYVGVYAGNFVNTETHFFHRALAMALAVDRDVDVPAGSCSSNTFAPDYGLWPFPGDKCVNSSTWIARAISPAFTLTGGLRALGSSASDYTDGRDPRYSTWTESYWDDPIDSRIFLVEDPSMQLATLLGGLAYFVGICIAISAFTSYVSAPSAVPVSQLVQD